MFEHWKLLTYFEHSKLLIYFNSEKFIFPSNELLDELHLHDLAPRKHVAHALIGLLANFNRSLVEADIYDWFCEQRYERVSWRNETLLFY